MRRTYTMSDEQFRLLMEASKPTPYMVIGGIPPTGPQENANNAWKSLGEEMKFKWDTAGPAGGDPKTFTAEPMEDL